MALTLLSLAVLATTVMAVPRPQLSPAASTSSASIIRCKAQIISQQDDTCRSIGLPWGLYDYQIFEANSFLNCEDIWVGTPICIPDVPLPSTVVCPTVTTVVRPSTSSVVNPSITTTVRPFTSSVVNTTTVRPSTSSVVNPSITTTVRPFTSSVVNTTTVRPSTSSVVNPSITTTVRPFTSSVVNTTTVRPSTSSVVNPSTTTVVYSTASTRVLSSTSTTASPSPTCKSIITSQPGQTCDTIARDNGLVGSDILDSNSFLNCNDIWPGTQICVPPTSNVPGCKHWVVVNSSMAAPGHSVSCSDVARPWVLDPTDIYNSNTFVNCDDIWPGTQICIPWKTVY
ncbi:hypothetical protein FRC16_010422 [Serendipita sp. 398]|nr:hypothetical protein FRC16_010422 [Serendipita sp. 398]